MKILLADMKMASHQMSFPAPYQFKVTFICLHREAEIEETPWIAALLLPFDLFFWCFFSFSSSRLLFKWGWPEEMG